MVERVFFRDGEFFSVYNPTTNRYDVIPRGEVFLDGDTVVVKDKSGNLTLYDRFGASTTTIATPPVVTPPITTGPSTPTNVVTTSNAISFTNAAGSAFTL